MLFLLNTTVIDVMTPEARLMAHWRRLGCRDPNQLQASDALVFVQETVLGHLKSGTPIKTDLAMDLAALIIAKTGANCLSFLPMSEGGFTARLRHLPTLVLETYRNAALAYAVDKLAANQKSMF